MDKRTSRFLLFQAAVILLLVVLSQFFMYPIAGKAALAPRMEKSTGFYAPRQVLEADMDSSIIYLLEINGQYCEKMFEKSLLFERYREKPLALLRPVEGSADYRFVARDTARDYEYTITDKQELVVLKERQSDLLTLAFVWVAATVILLGLCFGRSKKPQPQKLPF
ncbi:MAG: hypothetical protein GX650_00485 [Clostridiales bacterium]|nr:hypothetical protein [Clostridiales bacterium]